MTLTQAVWAILTGTAVQLFALAAKLTADAVKDRRARERATQEILIAIRADIASLHAGQTRIEERIDNLPCHSGVLQCARSNGVDDARDSDRRAVG